MTDRIADVIPLRIPTPTDAEERRLPPDPPTGQRERRTQALEVAAAIWRKHASTPAELEVVELLDRAASQARAIADQHTAPAPFRTRPPRPHGRS